MKKMFTQFILKWSFIGLIFTLHAFPVWSQTPEAPDGLGTDVEPYIIESLSNLLWIAETTNSGNDFSGNWFLQTADIDASETLDWNDGLGWDPIGLQFNQFQGNYDGNGFTIDGLYINRPDDAFIGLFGSTENAEIKNLGLINISIKGENYSGGLIGRAGSSTIARCYITGTVSGVRYVGGLAGEVRHGSTITDCFNTASATADMYVGGITGAIRNESVVSNVYNIGEVSGSRPGGLVGFDFGSEIKFSFWDVETTSQWGSYGGGERKMTEEMKDILIYISNDWNMKETGKEGIWNMGNDRNDGYPYLAWQYPDDPPHPEADNDFYPILSTEGISDRTSTGATLHGSVYFPGKPSATEYGFCWNTSGTPVIDDNKLVKDAIQRGEFSYEMKDLTSEHVYYVRAYAINDAGVVYGEELSFRLPPHGSGTETDPYLINSLANLLWLEEETNNRRLFTNTWFLQTSDIDASETINLNDGKGWKPMGRRWNSEFRGIYDGDGYEIDGLYINRPDEDYVGLFGGVRDAKVSNIGLTNANIVGRNQVGGIAGTVEGSQLNSCFTNGSIKGVYSVGGIGGIIYSASKVKESYNLAVVEGDNAVGGVVGNTSGSDFYDNYNLGSVKGNEQIGGFAGRSTSRLKNVYNAGKVAGHERTGGLTGSGDEDAQYSFWDIEASEQETSIDGYGITSPEMKDIFTFVTSYYDIKREGNAGVWNIGNGRNDGYPYLAWQYPDDPPHPEVDNDYLPIVFTEVIGGISENSVTLNGYISFEGQPTAERHGFCWNTTGMPTVNDEVLENGPVSAVGSYSMDVGELEPGQTYFARAFSINEAGVEYGEEFEFAAGPKGLGTNEDPYLIETLTHLLWIAQETNNGNTFEDQYFIQTKNIDALSTMIWHNGVGWDPIGNDSRNPFSGNYDGNGHLIKNLNIDRPNTNNIGMFGYLIGAEISKLGVNVDIKGRDLVAGIAGVAEMSVIRNCYVTGKIEGEFAVGGISNAMISQIIGSFNLADITGETIAGGLTGYLMGSEISNSYNLGRVTGVYYVGGLASVAIEESVINNSYNAGLVSGETIFAPLTGSADYADINFTFWDDEASGADDNNGGKGLPSAKMKDFDIFLYAGWDLKGVGDEGIWNIGNDRNNGYPYLSWQYSDDPPHPDAENDFLPVVVTNPATEITGESAILNGTFILEGKPAVTDFGFYWNTTGMPVHGDESSSVEEVSEGTFSFEITGLERGAVYYVRAYAVNENGTFYGDEVKFVLPPEGSGTKADPYLIATLGDLLWMARETNGGNDFSGKYFLQTSNIDAKETSTWDNGRGWQPVGIRSEMLTRSFRGNYDGNSLIIDNLFINRPGFYQGLFGYLDNAEVSSLGVTNANIAGDAYIGALAGMADYSTIHNTYSTGSVSGIITVGGLVGMFRGDSSSGNIDFCFSTANVSGTDEVGGLAGSATRVSNSYSTGIVIGSQNVGGLCGTIASWGLPYIKNCYSTSIVKAEDSSGGLIGEDNSQNIENSFWNTESSGLDYSQGGEGLTTEEMLVEMNFESWDFNEVWGIKEDDTYPYLKWQGEAWDHNYPHCSFPGNLDASDICSSSATLKWEDESTSSWNIQWGEEGFVPGRGDVEREVTETELTIDSLAPYTSHDFWVQSHCGKESSYWSGPYTFKTLKGEVVFSDITVHKEYDGKADATVDDWATSKWLHADHRVSIKSYQASFDNPNAGTDKTVTISNIELEGRDAERYYVTTPVEVKGDIDSVKLSIIGSFEVEDKVYDGTVAAVIYDNQLSLEGIIGQDEVILTGIAAEFTQSYAGEDIQVALSSVEVTGADACNYTISLIDAPDASASIIATYTLTIDVEGEGSVEVNGNSYSETMTFEDGSVISLEAIASEGWELEGWTGDVESARTMETLVMDKDNSITVEFIVATSIKDLMAENVVVYPNPFKDHIFIENIRNAKSITINDIKGNRMMVIQPGVTARKVISAGALTSGIYFLIIEQEDGERQIIRLIKE
ncbi:YDG domain-containing protein [Marinilabiliaceae bacterium ANBcel2]|nr:YDG domain-containing protein [Marinilabiliaceae bacterium ANBcel2]